MKIPSQAKGKTFAKNSSLSFDNCFGKQKRRKLSVTRLLHRLPPSWPARITSTNSPHLCGVNFLLLVLLRWMFGGIHVEENKSQKLKIHISSIGQRRFSCLGFILFWGKSTKINEEWRMKREEFDEKVLKNMFFRGDAWLRAMANGDGDGCWRWL